jgi:hypothetical protein
MTKKYTRKGGQGKNARSSFDPPKVFSMDRDIESQIPISKENMRYSESGDLIPPPPPFYREVREKTNSKPQELELDDIDKPFGEKTFVGPQKKTSIKPIEHDVENPLQNTSGVFGLEPDSEWGVFDDQFSGGKRGKTRNRRKYVSNKKKIKTKKRKSNRKK